VRHVTVLLLATFLVCGCTGKPDHEASKASLRPFDVTLDWTASPEFYGFYYARAAGIYAKHGLDVRLHNSGGAPLVAQDLGAGVIYAGTTTSDNLVRQIARGAEFSREVTLLAYNPVVVASRGGSGILQLKDLEGRTLGTNRDSSTYQQLLYLQEKGRVDLSKIEEYPIRFGGAEDLLEGRVDAVLAYGTNVMVELEARRERAEVVFLSSYGIYNYGEVLAFARGAVLDAAKVSDAVVDRFVAATLEGYRLCPRDIDACVQTLVKDDPTLDSDKFLVGIQTITRLTSMAAYPRSDLDRWVVGGDVAEEDRQAALALYRD
jgi:NitT/TauT family transport system substrate-binding protein